VDESLYARSGDGEWWFRKGSTFARDYGMDNPYEDFATVFEARMNAYAGNPDDIAIADFAAKSTMMNAYLDGLA
jgi:hypothetical protein